MTLVKTKKIPQTRIMLTVGGILLLTMGCSSSNLEKTTSASAPKKTVTDRPDPATMRQNIEAQAQKIDSSPHLTPEQKAAALRVMKGR